MRRCLAIATFAVFVCSGDAGAQQPASALDSYRQARRVFDRALVAHGGLERLRAIGVVDVRHEGTGYARNQSLSARAPWTTTPTRGRLILDTRAGRIFLENETQFPGMFRNQTQFVTNGREAWQVNWVERRWFTVPNAALTARRGLYRRLPHQVLLLAADRPEALRWVGLRSEGGRRYHLITYASDDNGQQITLLIDVATHLLAGFETVYDDAMTGDAISQVLFADYAPVNGVQFPGRRIFKPAGEVGEEVRYTDVSLDGEVPDSLWVRPEGLVDGNGGPAADTTLLKLADDVYVVQGVAGGNSSLVVVFDDFVLVGEAYGNEAASQRTLSLLRTLAPGKPVRYLVPTHYHDDHTGGVRAFIAEGSTIVTTPGNREYFERMAKAVKTLQPDALTKKPVPIKLETFTGRRVIEDARHRVEVIDIGPSPHANEMLVLYLPKEQVLFQGDLLNRTPDGRDRPGNQTAAHFLKWLDTSGLAVQRIVPVHGPAHGVAEVRRAVQMWEQMSGER